MQLTTQNVTCVLLRKALEKKKTLARNTKKQMLYSHPFVSPAEKVATLHA